MSNIDEHTPLISNSAGGPQPATDNAFLSRFQQAIGIDSTTTPQSDLESARHNAKRIYKEVLSAQKWRRNQYRFVEVIYYLAILANIVIGATLASLGPLSVLHPMAITVLGIVNTSTAGMLALLKGQGLPDRLRKDQFELRKVQDFIEETEARLAFRMVDDMTEKDLDDLVKEVFDKYNVARDTAEMNRPESYAHQVDDGSEERGIDGEWQGVSQAGGACQSKLALGGGKGKALVIS